MFFSQASSSPEERGYGENNMDVEHTDASARKGEFHHEPVALGPVQMATLKEPGAVMATLKVTACRTKPVRFTHYF